MRRLCSATIASEEAYVPPMPPTIAWYWSPSRADEVAANCLYTEAVLRPAVAEEMIIDHSNQN